MTVLERTATVTIRLEANCLDAGCSQLAHRMHEQLGVPHYSRGASLMAVPDSLEAWRAAHRTARKRADRAARLGYTFGPIDRSQFTDDLFEINTSKAERQGRPMGDGYLKRHHHGPLPTYACDRHKVCTYGVLKDERLVAYLTAYRCGALLMVSMILGHADHLPNDCMYALWQGVVDDQAHHGGFAYYNVWRSGENGLRYFKSKLGFREADVEWLLA